MYSGEPGSGAGRGGGGGGAIREAGGSFGKMEAAREDQYFYEKVIDWPYKFGHSIFIFYIMFAWYFVCGIYKNMLISVYWYER